MPRKYNKYLYDLIRAYVKDFYNESSNKMVMPKNVRVANIEIKGVSKQLLFDIIDLCINSDFLSDASRFYLIKCGYSSMQECLNREFVPDSFNNINKFNSKVTYDKNRLNKLICEYDEFDSILKYCDDINICSEEIKELYQTVRDRLNKIWAKEYHHKAFDDKLNIKISKDFYNNTLDDKSWHRLKSELKLYSVERAKAFSEGKIISDIDYSELIGYYNFLTGEKNLREIDKVRLMELKNTLGIK